MSQLIEFLITSSTLILFVIIIRACFMGKVKNGLIYALWLVVLVKLICPVNFFESEFSIMNGVELIQNTVNENAERNNVRENNQNRNIISATSKTESSAIQNAEKINEINPVGTSTPNNVENKENQNGQISYNADVNDIAVEHGVKTSNVKNFQLTPMQIVIIIWGIGTLLCLLMVITLNIRFRRSLLKNRKLLDEYNSSKCKVYKTDKVSTPCLYGVFNPTIYIPEAVLNNLSDRDIEQILEHENKHYAHKDHLWSFVRCLIVCVYWFHPLVWVAAKLSKKDAELFCDESILTGKNRDERIQYGEMLLSVARVSNNISILYPITAVHSGKREMKKRILFIGKNKKHYKAVAALLCVILLVGSLVTFTACNETKDMNKGDFGVIQYTNIWGDLNQTYKYKGSFLNTSSLTTEMTSEKQNMDMWFEECEVEEQVSGAVYELMIYGNEGSSLGYMYITEDKIYKFSEFEKGIEALENNQLPGDAYIVCQKEEMRDSLGKDEKGWHQYIEVKGDTIEYHSYNNQTEKGYFENIIWKKNVGIIFYQNGYGTQNNVTLEIEDTDSLIGKYQTIMKPYTNEEIYQVIEEDFDNCGRKEAFVLVNCDEIDEYGDEFLSGCELWYVKGNDVERIIKEEKCTAGGNIQMLLVGKEKHIIFNAENARLGSGTLTAIYSVEDGMIKELLSQIGLNLYAGEKGLTGYEWDYYVYEKGIDDWTGYATMPYQFYWSETEREYKEYVAEEIAEEEFFGFSNAKEVLNKIVNYYSDIYTDNDMPKVEKKYLKRENNTIDINLMFSYKNEERYKFCATVVVDGNSIMLDDMILSEGNKKLSLLEKLKEYEKSIQ